MGDSSTFDKERFGLITGSKVSVLFPKRSALVGQTTYAKELANQMYFRHYDNTQSWQTEHGHDGEVLAMIYWRENIDPNIEDGEFARIESWGGTSDALATDYGLDFKCPTSLNNWLDYLLMDKHLDHYDQAQMYCFLFDKPVWKIAAYLTETMKMSDNGDRYPVKESQRMIIREIEASQDWVEKLKERSPALIKMRDEFYKKLVEHFGENK